MANKGVIGLVSCGIDSSYHNIFVQNFADTCTELDMRVLWFQSLSGKADGDPHEMGGMNIFKLINFDMIDALVILALTVESRTYSEYLTETAAKHDVPVILVDGDGENAYCISLGYEEALGEVVRHVIEKHDAKNIKFLGAMKGNEASDSRENVFRKVMAEHGLEVTDDSFDYGYFWWAGAADAVQRHYDKFHSMPDAFICANDSMAIGACMKLNELGYKIPEDVIVTGVDGIPEGNTFFPSITTVTRNVTEAAKITAKRAAQILSGEIPREGRETVGGTILYRESCGCEPARRSTDDNMQKHELYEQIELWNGMSDGILRMSENVTGSYSFEETLERAKPFLNDMWTMECWLCICDNFITGVDRPEDVYQAYDDCRKDGYSETMKYVLHKKGEEYDMLPPFETSGMLPDMEGVLDTYKNLMFLPLHFQDRAIGYVAFEFMYSDRNFHLLHTLIANLSAVLENARIRSELKSVVSRLEDMYIRDSMTNLYNRRGFYQFTQKLYEKCVKAGCGFMIVSVDLDNLKGINDTYGHHEGDNAITTVAKALEAASEKGDIVARFGGDEYIVAGSCAEEGHGDKFMERLKKYLDDYNASSGKPYPVEASCGMCTLSPASKCSLDEFIKSADELMYAQKAIHRKHKGYARGRM